jgi:SAM-dependent methyltransferase
MTIYKSKDYVEVYRAKSKSKDINELTGRTGRPDLTQFVIDNIIAKLNFKKNIVVVDIGCGDGLLLRKASIAGADGWVGRLIGILPTPEEVLRVKKHIIEDASARSMGISIQLGLLDDLSNIPNQFSDITISNSTIHILQNETTVDKAILEMKRITKSGGKIYFGEVPDVDEFKGKKYGDSIIKWFFWVLKNQGISVFFVCVKQVLAAILTREPFVIAPKTIFYASPEAFIHKLEGHGLIIESYSKHKEIDEDGEICDSLTRWDYIAVRN